MNASENKKQELNENILCVNHLQHSMREFEYICTL